MRILSGWLLLVFLCIWIPAANAADPSDAVGGNRALMEEWNQKKSLVKQQIYDKLKREGKLPKNGRIEFEARIKPDPRNKDKVDIEVDKLRVIDSSKEASAQSTSKGTSTGYASTSKKDHGTEAYQPIHIPQVEMRNIEFTSSAVIHDFVELRDIELPGSAVPAGRGEQQGYTPSQPPAAQELPKEPEKKSWWERFLGN